MCKLLPSVVVAIATCMSIIFAQNSAFAVTFFSDFGAGDTYLQNGGLGIEGSTNIATSSYSAFGAQFAPSVSGVLTQIDLGLTNNFGAPAAVISLYNDVSGIPGGSLLGSWNVSPSGHFGSTNNTLVTIVGISGVTLVGGTSYWLVVGPSDPAGTTFDAWNNSSPIVTGNVIGYTDAGQLPSSGSLAQPLTLPAFDVLGEASSVSAVPEPSTWAMIILGFVGLGFLSYRQRTKTALKAA